MRGETRQVVRRVRAARYRTLLHRRDSVRFRVWYLDAKLLEGASVGIRRERVAHLLDSHYDFHCVKTVERKVVCERRGRRELQT